MGPNHRFLGRGRRTFLLFLLRLLPFVFGAAVQARGDALLWAQGQGQGFAPPQQAPQTLRNNISLEVFSAIEGLWQPRFQRYFQDSLAYYVQLQLGSDRASALHFAEEYRGAMYRHFQLGFELGLSGLLHAANAGGKGWGSGLIFGLGLRFMLNRLEGALDDWLLVSGFAGSLGWQLQARHFAISLYWELRTLLPISLAGGVNGVAAAAAKDLPVIAGRGPLRLALPEIPLLNSSLVSTLTPGLYFTLSQALNIRISYYF